MSEAYDVNVVVQVAGEVDLPEARLREAVGWVLAKHQQAPGAGLSVVFASDEDVRALNHEYRGIDRPTDVLSFSTGDDAGAPEGDAFYLGDLVLAVPYIQRQAASEGHSFADEVLLVAVHGTLHLLGYDHNTPANQDAMWAVQAEALAALGVAIEVPHFTFDDDAADDELSGE